VGASGKSPRAVPFICAGRVCRDGQTARLGEPGQRSRNLELPHVRRPDAVHAGSSKHSRGQTTCSRTSTGSGQASDGRTSSGRRETAGRRRKEGNAPAAPADGIPTRAVRSQARPRTEEEIVLPYLRFSRDKRGYEHTFVIQSDRRRGRSRTRILYWFRTPPGVKVGRSALDEIAIRSIEESNPDIDFDWTSILKEGAPEASAPAPRQTNQDRRNPRRPTEPRALRTPAVASAPPPRQVDAVVAPVVESAPVQTQAADAPLASPEPAIPATTPASLNDESPAEQLTLTPAHARLGVEGVLRLRARHAEILARISERVTDTARQDELKAQAERLNPDTWVTDDEVRVGLEGYESVLASLRGVVGQGRRRRRRGGPPREASPGDHRTAGQEVPGRASEPEQHASGGAHQDDDPEPEEEPV
jgi:hypothetical protein